MSFKLKKLKNRIPNKIQLAKDCVYRILYTKEDKHVDYYGISYPDKKQLWLNTNQSDTELVKTYLHEVAHAVSDVYGLELTEGQVLKLEQAFYYLLKPNNLITKE